MAAMTPIPGLDQSALVGQQVTVTAVTQAQLAAFLEVRRQAWRHPVLRDQLLDLLDGGAWVEPGPLRVRVERTSRRILSAGALTPVLGEVRYRELLDAVEPTVCRNLIVEEAPRREQ
jgi:hypothetical protein